MYYLTKKKALTIYGRIDRRLMKMYAYKISLEIAVVHILENEKSKAFAAFRTIKSHINSTI
ncbi:hypothetical protein Bhyg_12070 [Pseudolycoriella hygida]|uniref:Uncharacterized protein n=1 Tax=Pseudolycoriella hygida TaxID=35572 RepID=A0A9Q0MWJ8_9DIPT|nr:hypothetical protein Bhyg_12070 [Pseudolycoriella hygida]